MVSTTGWVTTTSRVYNHFRTRHGTLCVGPGFPLTYTMRADPMKPRCPICLRKLRELPEELLKVLLDDSGKEKEL